VQLVHHQITQGAGDFGRDDAGDHEGGGL
jgi:hypothetical protein